MNIPRHIEPERREKSSLPKIDTKSASSGSRGELDPLSSPKQSTPKQTPAKDTAAQNGTWTDSSNVGLGKSGLIGFGLSATFLLLLYPLRDFGIIPIFWDRGWVPFVCTLLLFWSWTILMLKWRKFSRQQTSMLLDVLPLDLSEDISLDSIDAFEQHIRSLPVEPGESFLVNRVQRGLEYFRVRRNASETAAMLESQSAIDANTVTSSYAITKVFIWALPIMGFIGTVIGVSAAVASLGGSLEDASDISVVKDSLNSVFAGLGTAFDTTLLALVMSLMVKLPASALQKSEEDLVTWVDEYCNENLLKRLNDGGASSAQSNGQVDTVLLRKELGAMMSTHQGEMENLVAQFQGTMEELGQQALTNQSDMLNSVHGSSKAFLSHYTGLEKGLTSLSDVLERLGEKQVLVQQVEKPKRSWFRRRGEGD
ncbi:MAG: hypothetical protein GXP26_04525 [Planctomycetes bacterium]|nr:hypothetical protein [Planctomycetota bacterium]